VTVATATVTRRRADSPDLMVAQSGPARSRFARPHLGAGSKPAVPGDSEVRLR
jgi:hypothetical protein